MEDDKFTIWYGNINEIGEIHLIEKESIIIPNPFGKSIFSHIKLYCRAKISKKYHIGEYEISNEVLLLRFHSK
ncbi:hypothetical protein THIOM_003339 [Candidatus Thiomargarita nelsonii]|uniref:Uncharacterized protein n=1 Tax=Candidatus Thiomargarita nelsonii TaxID=1003181 RepID=A0A176RYQ3_9GAMM|nr:hypothetical protein THIOM_003339 [Candidatus Thiomargarita nelsonii]